MAALATLGASRWTLFCAKWFGQKVVGIDDDWGGDRMIVTGYRWHGVLYMTDATRIQK